MKHVFPVLLVGLLLAPSLSFAQTTSLTADQKATIIKEIASLESQLLALLNAQVPVAPVATSTNTNQATIASLNAQIQADQVDIQNLKNEPRLEGCNVEFGSGQAINRVSTAWNNCMEWQSEDSIAENADQSQINADEIKIVALGGAATNAPALTDWCSTIYWQQHFCDGFGG